MVPHFTPFTEHQCLALIKKCTSIADLKPIHAHMVRTGLDQDLFAASKLIELTAISLTGHMRYADHVFSQTNHPNLFIWNTMIRGHARSNSSLQAISLYNTMRRHGFRPNSFSAAFVLKACCRLLRLEEGKQIHTQILKMGLDSDLTVENGLLRLYCICGSVDDARQLFEEMPERNCVSWSGIVSGYAQHGYPNEALALFREMQLANVEIDGFTLASVVGVCGDLGALELGKWVHSYIDNNGVCVDVVLGTSLVDMYAKCGDLYEALRVFQGLGERDVLAWSSMVGAYAIHGYGKEALQLFASMKEVGVRPNCVTFTSVLCACSHSGLVDDGCRNFNSMRQEYRIVPQIEHYGCMVDLFCRAGHVHRAHEFMKSMHVEPNVVMWRTLLNACKVHGEIELGEDIAGTILELEPHSGENYVLVSNVYASLARWSSVTKVRNLMKEKKARKSYGFSSIEVNFIVHEFVMGDKSHPESKEIYEMVNKIAWRLKQEGHVASTVDVLHDIDEEEKEHTLALHSERLAIAFGLLHTSEGSPIRIVKNLRVCGDCHTIIKLLSRIYKRAIIVRDRVRFHHFKEGKCSCKDYW